MPKGIDLPLDQTFSEQSDEALWSIVGERA
jgi:hypothetical protein